MATEPVGIRLNGGPFDGHTNIYPLAWPPPEEIVAFTMAGQVAIADAAHEAQAQEVALDVTRYGKSRQSQLGDVRPSVMVRGAVYVVKQGAGPGGGTGTGTAQPTARTDG